MSKIKKKTCYWNINSFIDALKIELWGCEMWGCDDESDGGRETGDEGCYNWVVNYLFVNFVLFDICYVRYFPFRRLFFGFFNFSIFNINFFSTFFFGILFTIHWMNHIVLFVLSIDSFTTASYIGLNNAHGYFNFEMLLWWLL